MERYENYIQTIQQAMGTQIQNLLGSRITDVYTYLTKNRSYPYIFLNDWNIQNISSTSIDMFLIRAPVQVHTACQTQDLITDISQIISTEIPKTEITSQHYTVQNIFHTYTNIDQRNDINIGVINFTIFIQEKEAA